MLSLELISSDPFDDEMPLIGGRAGGRSPGPRDCHMDRRHSFRIYIFIYLFINTKSFFVRLALASGIVRAG